MVNVAQVYVQYRRRILIQYFVAVISYCSFSLMAVLLNLIRLFIVSVLFNVSTSDELPANFVFGDSLVDVGNNNYLVSFSKANYLPNGIDFGRPTGRFTNGRTIVDIIGKLYHLVLLPMFFCSFIYFLILLLLLSDEFFFCLLHQVRNWVWI